MNKKFTRLEELEQRIDEMVSAIDWWRNEASRREEVAFVAGWTYATADIERGHRTGEHVITVFRKWKYRLDVPNSADSRHEHITPTKKMDDLIEELEMWAKHDPTDTSIPFGRLFTRAATELKRLEADLVDRIKGERSAWKQALELKNPDDSKRCPSCHGKPLLGVNHDDGSPIECSECEGRGTVEKEL